MLCALVSFAMHEVGDCDQRAPFEPRRERVGAATPSRGFAVKFRHQTTN